MEIHAALDERILRDYGLREGIRQLLVSAARRPLFGATRLASPGVPSAAQA